MSRNLGAQLEAPLNMFRILSLESSVVNSGCSLFYACAMYEKAFNCDRIYTLLFTGVNLNASQYQTKIASDQIGNRISRGILECTKFA
jgi:hypothetical protein